MTQPDELRSLLEAATPGPWSFEPMTGDGWAVGGNDDTPEWQPDAYSQVVTLYRDDAALIVALVNLAPQLLTLWEAARELRSSRGGVRVAEKEPPYAEVRQADYDALRAALAALESKH